MEIFKYSKIDEYTLNNLSGNSIYFNSVSKLNDPYEFIFNFEVDYVLQDDFLRLFYGKDYDKEKFLKYNFEDIKQKCIFDQVNEIISTTGMSCFTQNNTSLVMWGNYGDKHKGICIGYDTNYNPFKHATPVNYSENILCIPITQKENVKELYLYNEAVSALFWKCLHWKYEEEYRIIFKSNKKIKYVNEAIIAIYFGLRTTEEDINRVLINTSHIKNLKYYKADLSPIKYELFYREIKNPIN